MQKLRIKIVAFLLACAVTGGTPAETADSKSGAECRYLLFQIFTFPGAGSPGQQFFPPQGELESDVRDITSRIGAKGDRRNKLGVCVGIALSNSDEAVRIFIKDTFALARRYDVALAFHLDDQMFWTAQKDLANKDNIEWIDWSGTPCTGRRLDWGPKPTKAPAQLCLNSSSVRRAITERARLIGIEIKKELDALRREGKEYLFAGIIAGWESMIGQDFDTNKQTGYHALANRGLTKSASQKVLDEALVSTLREFMELWARTLAAQGIPENKIYAHIAFTEQGFSRPGQTPMETCHFASPDVAFDRSYRPGFSTYPSENSIEQIQEQVQKHGNPPWISAEGTNVVPDGMMGEPNMETYLGKMFNHGAVAVNIYSWGMGGESQRNNMFRKATENDEALDAYRKFLANKPLIEQARPANQFSPNRFRAKIEKIQSSIPPWLARTHRPDLIEPLMQQLDAIIKSHHFQEADSKADEVLNLLSK